MVVQHGGSRGSGMVVEGTRVRQYELIRELGRGAMGRVYLARDTRLGRRVAMKFLPAGRASSTSGS